MTDHLARARELLTYAAAVAYHAINATDTTVAYYDARAAARACDEAAAIFLAAATYAASVASTTLAPQTTPQAT